MKQEQQRAYIQIQDITGNWVTVLSCLAQDQIILQNINSIQRSYKKTTRAVDKFGNIMQLSSAS